MIDFISDQAVGNWPGYAFRPFYRAEYCANY